MRRSSMAMVRGRELTVRGTSLKGTYSEDTYSLIGFTKTPRRHRQGVPLDRAPGVQHLPAAGNEAIIRANTPA